MTTLRNAVLLACFGWCVLPASSSSGAVVELDVEFVEGEGYVEADLGPGPQLVDVPVGVRHRVSLDFNRIVNRVIPRLGPAATMDAEFVIDNTSNPHDLSYDIRAVFHRLQDDFLPLPILITDGTVGAGELASLELPLQTVQNGDLVGMSFSVDTLFVGGGTEGTFGFYVAGGGGDPNRVAMGPVRWAPAHLVGPQPGDVDWNGDVDLLDLFNVQNNFGLTSPPHLGDSDGDGDIDLQDLFDVQNNFGVRPGAVMVATVPEPASVVFAVAVIGALCGSRRHRVRVRNPR